ncbi:MAG: hypothetical protein OWR52_02030 [Acidibacillus sp.]|uniref:Uncharacterized protein n=1 Tax=Sulfoacidibacillus ferrooxidans TaxID=2005001 RepID=A0A9X1VC83_9BACL|nr:hypothetical protein [Sulfoacidibacillus ferrooxidans]MCI0183367.1 hypothetical protein [Sulfoacidibacillus ferrooxidans]MCY0892277.1 hypothetical protein [Acidibacillus sp.]
MMPHRHWEVDSECPRCGKINHASIPVGERVVRIHCEHCTHGYDYLHVVAEHTEVEDMDGEKE